MAFDVMEKQATVDDVMREVSRIKSVVTDAVEDGVKSALRAVNKGRDFVKQGRDMAEDAVHDARYAIKRNPFQAAGILFAAGVVIGSLVTMTCTRRD